MIPSKGINWCHPELLQRESWEKFKSKIMIVYLWERRARTSRGGTIVTVIAFSRSFQERGVWFSQKMWETRRWARSGDGREIPAAERVKRSSRAHWSGSTFFSWADLISDVTDSHRLSWESSGATAIVIILVSLPSHPRRRRLILFHDWVFSSKRIYFSYT